jgi:hypothetical protein
VLFIRTKNSIIDQSDLTVQELNGYSEQPEGLCLSPKPEARGFPMPVTGG